MSNRLPINTIAQAVAVYGTAAKTARAFRISVAEVHRWALAGYVPRQYHLGMFLGLQVRGRRSTPHLFGLVNWAELPGHGKA